VRTVDVPDAATTTVAPDAPRIDRRAIAVLPFENMSAEPGTDHFGDGVSEEKMRPLSTLP